MLGLACGLAILCKLSALGFILACGLALFASRWLLQDGKPEKEKTEEKMDRLWWPGAIAMVALVTCAAIWAGYRFQVGPLADGPRPHVMVDETVGSTGTIHDWAYSVVEARWIPAPAFWQGIRQLKEKQSVGHRSYFLGQIRETGWWYFFPVALAVKTSIPFLILVGMGSFYLGKATWSERNWAKAAPVTAALALLVFCSFSHINIGLRHILAIYPLLAIIGGVGACHFWRLATPPFVGPSVVVVLLIWHLASSFQAHPDYLPYFNEFAGHHPEEILIDSDLDWGQDLLRLSAALKKRDVRDVSIVYSGTADLARFDLPAFQTLQPHQPATGWIAISMLALKTGADRNAPRDSFEWLESYNPVCTVGASIRLYYVPEPVPSH
jgi:hypothetical protein